MAPVVGSTLTVRELYPHVGTSKRPSDDHTGAESEGPVGLPLIGGLVFLLVGGAILVGVLGDSFWRDTLLTFGLLGAPIIIAFVLSISSAMGWLGGKRVPAALWIPRTPPDVAVYLTDEGITKWRPDFPEFFPGFVARSSPIQP